MSILVGADSRVLVQGITGRQASFCVADLDAYGTRVVGGVVPGKGGSEHLGHPIYDFVDEAVAASGANVALVFVPPTAAAEAITEALEAGVALVVYPGDWLPVHDAIRLRRLARERGLRLVGPNTPGVITPGACKVGFMPSACFRPGRLGVISKSGSLSYEVCSRLTEAGIGQSTLVGVGGDPVKGLTIGEALEMFDADPGTSAVLLLGEIGGVEEHQAAAYATGGGKPLVAYLVGRTAPVGRRLGHAGALIGSHRETYEAKTAALEAAGAIVARELDQVPALAAAALEMTLAERRA